MKYIFTLINLALLSVSAFFCADIFYKAVLQDASYISELKEPAAKPSETEYKQTNKESARQGNGIIIQRNLFKVETEKKDMSGKDPAKEHEKLETTTLSLTLWGTVTGGAGVYAVIEDKKTRVQALFQEGDSIQDATIKKILKKEIILTYQGKDQRLEMETDPEKSGPVKKPLNNPISGEEIMPRQNQAPLQPPDNPGQIASKIKLRPFFSKGAPDGVMVYAIRPESAFNKIGLRNGDIVKAIDGTAVSSIEEASSLLAELEGTESAKITLIRSGETKEISYNSAGDRSEAPDSKVQEELKEEKIPNPEDHGDIKQPPGLDTEPEKAEISEDQN